LHFLAHYLGWELSDWNETLEPVLAERRLECGLGTIQVGQVAGVRQVAEGMAGGRRVLRLVFQAAIGQAEARDRIEFESDPPIEVVIPGGVHGDAATSAVLGNTLPALCEAAPGLHTMARLRSPRHFG
jgi:4-hydroxy-tetrahydrodipicolinate reductase